MRLRFGPSSSRTTAARTAALLGLSIVAIEAFDGVEHVSFAIDPAPPPDPVVRPTVVYAVYSPAPPADGETPEEHLAGPGRYVGVASVPESDAGPIAIAVPGTPPATPFHVQTILGYPD